MLEILFTKSRPSPDDMKMRRKTPKIFTIKKEKKLSLIITSLLPGELISYLPNPSARAGYDTRSIS